MVLCIAYYSLNHSNVWYNINAVILMKHNHEKENDSI